MTDKRISELTSATSLGDADVFPIVQSGETKKLTGSAVKSYAQSGVVLASEKGANSGVATLGSDGKLTASQLPDLAVSDYLGSVASQTAMLALTGQKGDWCTRSDLGTTWVISGVNPSLITGWTELSYPTAPVTSVAGKTGAVSLVKGDVGLGNVDNTSDANKPISSATQTALDGKQTKITASGITKGDGNGGITAATAGTDYLAPSAVGSTIVAQTGTNGAAQLPSGSTAQRPGTPAAGYIRYNATTGKFEGYGSAWGNIGGGAFIGDTAPANPGAGDLWWNSATGHTFVFYGSAWVDLFGGAEGQYLPLTGGTISGALSVTGNVGIGTSSPSQKLQVVSASGGTTARFSNVNTGNFIDLYETNTSTRLGYIGTTDGTNWTIHNDKNGYIGFDTNNTERARIDSSGNFLVGTTSTNSFTSAAIFSIKGLAVAWNDAQYIGMPYGAGTGYYNGLYLNAGTRETNIRAIADDGASKITFSTGITAVERARIDGSGNLLVGTTSQLYGTGATISTGARSSSVQLNLQAANGAGYDASMYFECPGQFGATIQAQRSSGLLRIWNGAGTSGVTLAGAGTSWGTFSDERLKDIIGPIENAVEKVRSLRAVIAKYKSDPDDKRRSVLIAQDVQAALPEAVYDDKSEEKYLSVAYTDTIPLLVAAIKELTVRLEALEAH